MLEIVRCKRCGEEIVWTVTTNGKKMPVNPEPDPGGTFILDDSEDPPVATFIRESERDEHNDLYVCHLEDCF